MNILRFIIPKSLVEYIDSDSTVRQGLEKMKYHRYVAIPVLDSEGRYIGTLRNDDIYKHFMEKSMTEHGPAGRASVMEILDTGYLRPLIHSASFEELFDRVKEHNFVPVVDDRGCFIGLILRRNVMDYLWECYKRRES
ncbi:MAG: CBS domain-containing protein [Clostridia bacterium]|nr:CBS domain-containing protein [Clostridia bacterium]